MTPPCHQINVQVSSDSQEGVHGPINLAKLLMFAFGKPAMDQQSKTKDIQAWFAVTACALQNEASKRFSPWQARRPRG